MALDSKNLDEQLQKQRRTAEENDAKRRAEHLGLTYLDLISVKTPTEIKAMKLVSEEEARKSMLVPLQLFRKKLAVAVFDPERPETKIILSQLKEKFDLQLFIVSLSGLTHVWEYYKYVASEDKEISGSVEINEENLLSLQTKIKTLEDLKNAIQNFASPLVSQILEIILAGALALKASDIHLEPAEKAGTFRLRIDGLLHAAFENFTQATYHAIVTRIKLLSSLKLNVTDEPQDGRFTIKLKNRDIEIRTSVIPSEYGETLVLRLLDPISLKVDLKELGWRTDDLEIVMRTLKKPNGLILNTGPTGSGKTTTLYAFLKYVFKPEIKIITVEDPIEYHLQGISQTQVDPEAGYTFASGLRSILRQDPNIILVGEIRDKETAEIAMNAALTGHIVFSTLHTNDAIGAIPRLLDLGAQTQTLGPALSLIIAQRLLRLLCPDCKIKKPIDKKTETAIKTFLEKLPTRVNKKIYENITLYAPKGCEKCAGLGYRGRISIFELFEISEKIEEAIYKTPTEIQLALLAKGEEMTTMQEDGVLKAIQGLTSLEEVERLTGSITWLTS